MTRAPTWLTAEHLTLMQRWEAEGYQPKPTDLYRECPRGKRPPSFFTVITMYNTHHKIGAGITPERMPVGASAMEQQATQRSAMRRCIGSLCDGMPFMSLGSGNRLCSRCTVNAHKMGY